MKILIIEDEVQLAEAISEILRKNNFMSDISLDGEDGYYNALTGSYDIIILDVMLPKMDGITVIRKLRDKKVSTPVLMLSAKSETYDKVKGLDSGADDYLAKPFSSLELIARLKAMTRRSENYRGEGIRFGDFELDANTLKLTCKNKNMILSAKEYHIIETLAIGSGKNIDKERMVEKIWGYDYEGEYNTAEVYISFIRKKLAAVGSKVQIKAVRGIGYRLEYSDEE